jgi:selenocysteine lyase/cysteine desulfurase
MNQRITTSNKLVLLQAGPKQEGKGIDSANKENIVGGSHQNPKKIATALDIPFIRENIIGYNMILDGPFGPTPMVYADATASAKSLAFIEDYIRDVVFPMYANTHTESSATGSQTTAFRNQARAYVHEALGAPSSDYAVVFVGSGSTGAMNKLAHVLGISPIATKAVNRVERPVVFISYYEHHSNELLWRESNADLVVIPENRETGSLDMKFLESKLIEYQNRPLILASFSAASNVTGIAADVQQVTELLHRYAAVAAWDFAAAGPHRQIDAEALSIDALYISTHKYIGGPQTPGILVARRSLFKNPIPTVPGGGTVSYVQPNTHKYLDTIEDREEGGTPAIIESIRAGLVLKLHHQVKSYNIEAIEQSYLRRALRVWEKNPNLVLLGNAKATNRVPIVSFLVKVPGTGKYLHFNFIVALLNDLFGIQSRGGCACAGPYGHVLLDISESLSNSIYQAMESTGNESIKPGWTRLSFKYYMSLETVDYLISAVDLIAHSGHKLIPWYIMEQKSNLWRYGGYEKKSMSLWDLTSRDHHVNKPLVPPKMGGGGGGPSSLHAQYRNVERMFANLDPDDAPAVGTKFDDWDQSTDALCWFVLPYAEL